MRQIRERDLTLSQNASSVFSEHNMEYSNMIDISNQSQLDSEQFKDYFTIIYSGDLSQFKLIQENIEKKLFSYNLKYLYLVNINYYENNKKYLEQYLKLNPKQNDLVIAHGNVESIEADHVYCILNDHLVYMQNVDDNNFNLLAQTLSLKINKELEKIFVKQIDF
ncbi:hypothetical protein TTHERM_01093760 (macronuclear) [Tetrahymena thermophila SB210]|uniref:Uncharacterized protein n=1 Tax=Tetrahymena thermophila (strain SB210) TaxID=312017 RepID=Q22BL9_TETTS|nr:hypothetical protein TTHERM_01093760 [Tetrahymena thermophila SB210]EAR82710.3 hypothetical protein TTHERM_01093760 [Tetrahymena thermophila SB210]|eukprot:XP_001030373.3 hypothetical protein TTHERM_01093760 [Tetrahymena thermophila SB210]